MSDYQTARARFGRAVGEHQAARQAGDGTRLAAATAELADAGRILRKFEIDPEARCPQCQADKAVA